jgi:hypothetical protein
LLENSTLKRNEECKRAKKCEYSNQFFRGMEKIQFFSRINIMDMDGQWWIPFFILYISLLVVDRKAW